MRRPEPRPLFSSSPAHPLLPESPFQRRDPGAPPSPGQGPSPSAPPRARARKGAAVTAASGPGSAGRDRPAPFRHLPTRRRSAAQASGRAAAEPSAPLSPPRPAPAPEESYRPARLLGGLGDGRPPAPAGVRAPERPAAARPGCVPRSCRDVTRGPAAHRTPGPARPVPARRQRPPPESPALGRTKAKRGAVPCRPLPQRSRLGSLSRRDGHRSASEQTQVPP